MERNEFIQAVSSRLEPLGFKCTEETTIFRRVAEQHASGRRMIINGQKFEEPPQVIHTEITIEYKDCEDVTTETPIPMAMLCTEISQNGQRMAGVDFMAYYEDIDWLIEQATYIFRR